MALKRNGVDLSTVVFGLGTSANPLGYSAVKASGYYENGKALYFVPRSDAFMPFSYIEGYGSFLSNESAVFADGMFAGVNAFVSQPTARYTYATDSSNSVSIQYKGGGTWNSLGTLRLSSRGSVVYEASGVPPVIMVACQAAGGAGGMGKQFYANYYGGGGGGGGAFTAFYLQLPYESKSDFSSDITFSLSNGNISLRFSDSDGVLSTFLSLFGGGDGGDATTSNYGFGGSGGSASAFPNLIPDCVAFCNFYSGSSTSSARWVDGGRGGNGGHAYDSHQVTLIREAPISGSDSELNRIYVDASGSFYPTTSYGVGYKFPGPPYNVSTLGTIGGGGGGAMLGNGGKFTTGQYGAGANGDYFGVSSPSGASGCVILLW